MTSTQKLPKHDAYAATTQKSEGGDRPALKPYKSGSNVHKGSIPKDPDGPMPMSQPHKKTY
jgi:hypothetical protein